MRLGVFIPEGSSPSNGQGMYQDGMIEGLTRQTRHQIVVLISERDSAPALASPHEVVRIKSPRRRLFSATSLDVFGEVAGTLAARRARVDAVVGNGQLGMPRPPNVPRIVVLFEAAFAAASPWGMYPALTQRQWVTITKRNLRNAAAVVALSQHGANEIEHEFGVPSERIVIGPPALRPFPASDASRYRPERPYVLVVGWFHPRKDVMLALAAWRSARERGLDRDLVLAGAEGPIDRRNGTIGRRILDAVGHELAARVHFTGLIPRGELGALYRGADALLMTSRQEGFGIPAIEAFSLGVPVVAAARTSLAEIVAPAGRVVGADAATLGSALIDACSDPADTDGMRSYAASFTVERQVAPLLEIADRLATR